MPAIHLKKEEVGDTFHATLGTPAGLDDPTALAAVAREHLRARFLAADATLTGMNFAIAETGGFVVCTNEGNADLGMALAPVHVASVGIEKVIPRVEDLAVFLRLLARSATGQSVTVYSSHVHGPRAGQALLLGAKASALLDGRTVPSLDDIRNVALPVMRHRLLVNFQAEADGVTADDVIGKLLAAVKP